LVKVPALASLGQLLLLLLTVLPFCPAAVCSEAADRLCRDASHLVKVPALASLGQLLPLLPAADAAATKPPLLALFASTAKPPATIAGTVPALSAFMLVCGRLCRLRSPVHIIVLLCMVCMVCSSALPDDEMLISTAHMLLCNRSFDVLAGVCVLPLSSAHRVAC
jgi:hypothetical protein